MFRTLALLALLAAPVFADDKPKPHALTAKEIADGWVMLFDGETTFGWKVEGDATVKDGTLVLGGEKATRLVTTSSFAVGELRVRFSTPDGKPAKGGQLLGPFRAHANFTGKSEGELSEQFGIDRPPPVTGPIAVEVPAGQKLVIHRFALRAQLSDTLFNGKDLTGWKVNGADPKRMASKWSVTKDGELAVKDGPGDLVCEKEFGNFVLQFECKTNGKALNSGIFFRCIPGQYQNGYEAQIQNAYKDDDRTKPADFGTGAIYRRIAARKVVSNDNEWFTMTVAANGKHISTWVNGYQTVDWTDDRKDDENPRKGYRAAKGPLSIQGHDPTTDILFRNIRASELPAK
jgi:hypothetical protein